LTSRHKGFSKIVEGVPLVLVDHGQPLTERMRRSRVTREEILVEARLLHGLERLEDIKFAVLEANGKISIGRLGRDCSVERAYADARSVGLQLLATIRVAVGSLNHVEAVVKLLGMVNAEPDFGEHPKVINGCSDVLVEVLGERGKHARSAVGMGSLPNGMTVEVEAIIQIAEGH
jgi:enamine deaminase RidA (YjgF/YER057c/UK114 family)